MIDAKTPLFRERAGRPAYVLLETVLATGLLILGLAVIGAQIQGALTSLHDIDHRTRALMLAQQHMAELDLGLVDLESADNVEEGDFGPRYPDWGWRMTTEETGVAGMYLLEVAVLYRLSDGDYRENAFEHDEADVIHSAYAVRPGSQAINFGEDLGLEEDEIEQLSKRLADLNIPGLDAFAFDPKILGRLNSDELLDALPAILEAFGFSLADLRAMLPPDVLEQIEKSGIFDSQDAEGAAPTGDSRNRESNR